MYVTMYVGLSDRTVPSLSVTSACAESAEKASVSAAVVNGFENFNWLSSQDKAEIPLRDVRHLSLNRIRVHQSSFQKAKDARGMRLSFGILSDLSWYSPI
jgi:hypothetical protein